MLAIDGDIAGSPRGDYCGNSGTVASPFKWRRNTVLAHCKHTHAYFLTEESSGINCVVCMEKHLILTDVSRSQIWMMEKEVVRLRVPSFRGYDFENLVVVGEPWRKNAPALYDVLCKT
jgi:hypothetical protein